MTHSEQSDTSSKIANAIRALAVGDAFGYPYEFIKDVRVPISKEGIREITDDTQMTLYGLEAVHRYLNLGGELKSHLTDLYVSWFLKQEEETDCNGSLVAMVDELNYYRAPGNTCLSACLSLYDNATPVNDSKGCGAVMRLLPFLLVEDSDAVMAGLLTHKHNSIPGSVMKLMSAYRTLLQDTGIEITTYRRILESGGIAIPKAKSITDIGLGWTSDECVDMAIWSFTSARNFEELLDLSVAHPGDSDSVAAVACSLWGIASRPGWQKYYEQVNEREMIDFFLEKFL